MNLEELKKLGVRYISIRDGLDLDPKNMSAVQEFHYHILSAFAQLERDIIRERTLAGLERAKAEGKTLGRPPGALDKKKRRTIGYYKKQ
jgi:DNA invertase Pin-like site-specific DNA recombinase